jgi:NADH:ubiquinone oxidoreductase subunit
MLTAFVSSVVLLLLNRHTYYNSLALKSTVAYLWRMWPLWLDHRFIAMPTWNWLVLKEGQEQKQHEHTPANTAAKKRPCRPLKKSTG